MENKGKYGEQVDTSRDWTFDTKLTFLLNLSPDEYEQTYAKGTCFDRKLKKIIKIIIGHKYNLSGYLKKCIIRYVEINKKKVA